MGTERDREIRRRRARRNKTHKLKARIAATTDSRLKAKLIQKLKRANPYLREVEKAAEKAA